MYYRLSHSYDDGYVLHEISCVDTRYSANLLPDGSLNALSPLSNAFKPPSAESLKEYTKFLNCVIETMEIVKGNPSVRFKGEKIASN